MVFWHFCFYTANGKPLWWTDRRFGFLLILSYEGSVRRMYRYTRFLWFCAPSAPRRPSLPPPSAPIVCATRGRVPLLQVDAIERFGEWRCKLALGVSLAGVQHAPHPRVGNTCEHSQHEFRRFRKGWMTGRCGEGARPPHNKCGGRPRPFFLSGHFDAIITSPHPLPPAPRPYP